MRKNQFIGFAFVSVCLWALVTYYLFLDRPLSHKPDQVSDTPHYQLLAAW